jgi:phosphatidylglycerol:prolipoprotein diacylglycerol transferase
MFYHPNIDPILLKIYLPEFLPITYVQVTWYGLSYVISFLLANYYFIFINKKYIKISYNIVEELFLYVILGVVIGGRIGYVIFYEPMRYFNNPIEILKTYVGGMSFHGGLLGVIAACYLFINKHSLKYLLVLDMLALVSPIGLFFGRIANFINQELVGNPTDFAFGMIFPMVDNQLRHPSQIYEALTEGLLTFIIINYLFYKNINKISSGYFSYIFLCLYGFFRSICEIFRMPDNNVTYMYNTLTEGQILSIPMFILGLICLIKQQNSNASSLFQRKAAQKD